MDSFRAPRHGGKRPPVRSPLRGLCHMIAVSRRCFPLNCLKKTVRIHVSSAKCSAKFTCRVRMSERNLIFSGPPLGCPSLGPSDFWGGINPQDAFRTDGGNMLHPHKTARISYFNVCREGLLVVLLVENIRRLPNDNKISDCKIRKISKFYCHGISQKKYWSPL